MREGEGWDVFFLAYVSLLPKYKADYNFFSSMQRIIHQFISLLVWNAWQKMISTSLYLWGMIGIQEVYHCQAWYTFLILSNHCICSCQLSVSKLTTFTESISCFPFKLVNAESTSLTAKDTPCHVWNLRKACWKWISNSWHLGGQGQS